VANGWAVLRTQPRQEPLAARAVVARGLESYVPKLPSRRRPSVSAPLFPGYVFAQIVHGADDLLRIRSAPGVAYVLPRTGVPALLPDAVIDAMRAREAELSVGGAPEFRHGEVVRVKAGPFRWVEGLFDRRLSASGRVRILLNLVHGSAAVDIDVVHLEPASPARRR